MTVRCGMRVAVYLALAAVLVSTIQGGCTPPSPTGGGSGGGGGNNGGGGVDNGGGGGVPVDIPDFVDSGGPPFEGADAVPAQFYERVYGQEAKVELPSGVSLSLRDLRLISPAGDAEVSSDGSATPVLPGFEVFLTQVVDSSDRIVLYGYAQAAGATPLPINARSTAVVLLYFALGSWTLPDKNARLDVIRDLNYSYNETVDELTAVIENVMRDNARAIQDGDERILSAVITAKTQILATAAGATAKSSAALEKSGPNLQAIGSGAVGFISTDPDRTVAQSGIFLRTSFNSAAITPLNRFRRRAKLYAYLTSTESAAGEITTNDPIEYWAGPVDILRSGADGGEDGFIAQVSGDSTFWNPTFSPPIFLVDEEVVLPGDEPLVPDENDTAIQHFDVVVLGPALDRPDFPPLLEESRYGEQVIEFLNVIDELTWRTFLLDFFVPVIDEVGIGALTLGSDVTDDATVAALRELVEPVITGQGISIKTTEGYSAALDLLLTTFQTDTAFRNAYLSIMKRKLGTANAALSYDGVGKNALRTLLSMLGGVIIEEGTKQTDLGTLHSHLQQSQEADLWRATVSRVEIYPKKPEVTKQYTRIRLAAKVAVAGDRLLCYEWSSPSSFGYLSETQGASVSSSFLTDEAAINYTATPTQINDNNLDTVSVTVYDMTDADGATSDCAANAGLGVSLGTSTVKVYGNDQTTSCEGFDISLYNGGPLSLVVSPGRVLPGDEVTVTVSYDFTQTTATSTFIYLYLPLACGYCLTGECFCGPEELAGLLYDGGATPVTNVSQQRVISGIGFNAAQELPGLGTQCAWELSPVFQLPNSDVREVVTRTFTYVFHKTNFPRQEGLGPVCPSLGTNPFSPLDQAWHGLFVIARDTIGGTGSVAAQLLDIGEDPSFDHEVSDPCEDN